VTLGPLAHTPSSAESNPVLTTSFLQAHGY